MVEQEPAARGPAPLRPFPPRLLCGPGPSNVHPAVYAAMAEPIAGHLDPVFLALVDDVCAMLRTCFGTTNDVTFPVSGTGSAGMEAAFVNLLEPGDTAVVCVNGVFGERMCDVAGRCGAEVVRVDFAWGAPVDPDVVRDTVRAHRDVRLVAFVHAETSTGAWSDAAAVTAAVRDVAPDAFVVADTVTSLTGVDVRVDDWGVDACYSGTQKCLSVPPGLAPVTFSDRAMQWVRGRSTPVRSWYLDLNLITRYLDAQARAYHHTAPISMLLGLHAGLQVATAEGLDARAARHLRTGRRLQEALEDRGYRLLAAEGARLPQLTSVALPDGVEDAPVRRALLTDAGIEIGGALGPWAGTAWRIGLMGENADDAVVDRLLDALP